MELYGSVRKTEYTFGKWYLEIPDLWTTDENYARMHPDLEQPNLGWDLANPFDYEFYKLDVSWVDFDRVFDLRGDNWRDKLLMFIRLYGDGWTSKGGIVCDSSPLEHLTYLGNYHVLSSSDYLWAVMNHGPDDKGSFVEIWYYVNIFQHPENFYELHKLDKEEFLK